MPHITAQFLSANTMRTGHGHTAGQGQSEENRKNERLNSPAIQLDLSGLSAKSLLAIPDSSSSSNRSPHTQKLNFLPTSTPTSTTSATFDSPQKSSPSSTVSSAIPFMSLQRADTPIAELEDTSPAYICPELEDTSNHAIRSHFSRNISSYTLKSNHPTVSHSLNICSGEDGL